MFMRNVGVLSLFAYCMGARTQLFLFIYFFLQKELILPSFLDVLSVVSCSLREWSNNEPAHRHKKYICRKLENQLKKKKKKLFSDYVVRIGAFLY